MVAGLRGSISSGSNRVEGVAFVVSRLDGTGRWVGANGRPKGEGEMFRGILQIKL